MRAGGEGNVTVFLAVPLLEEQIPFFSPVNEIHLGEEDIGCTLEKMAGIRSSNHRNENDVNTLVECRTKAISPFGDAGAGPSNCITIHDGEDSIDDSIFLGAKKTTVIYTDNKFMPNLIANGTILRGQTIG